jgi:hypothetical protein
MFQYDHGSLTPMGRLESLEFRGHLGGYPKRFVPWRKGCSRSIWLVFTVRCLAECCSLPGYSTAGLAR